MITLTRRRFVLYSLGLVMMGVVIGIYRVEIMGVLVGLLELVFCLFVAAGLFSTVLGLPLAFVLMIMCE